MSNRYSLCIAISHTSQIASHFSICGHRIKTEKKLEARPPGIARMHTRADQQTKDSKREQPHDRPSRTDRRDLNNKITPHTPLKKRISQPQKLVSKFQNVGTESSFVKDGR